FMKTGASWRVAGEILIDQKGDCKPMGIYPKPFWRRAIVPAKRPGPLRERLSGAWRTVTSIPFLVPLGSLVLITQILVDQSTVTEWLNYAVAMCLIAMSFLSSLGTAIGAVVLGQYNWILLGLPAGYATRAGHVLGNVSSFAASVLFLWLSTASSIA